MSRYQLSEQVATSEPVQVLCHVLEVRAAGYYQWRRRADRPTPVWEPAATAAFSRHAQRYGTRRLRAALRAEGHIVGRYALRNWLRRRGLRALSTRPQRPRTTVADPAAVVAENRLLGRTRRVSLPLLLQIRSGWATLRTYRWLAGAGAIGPPGAIPARGA